MLDEDGQAMIEAIEKEAVEPDKLPADIFRLIESCLHALGQRAKRQDISNEVIKQREPERLLQVEAIMGRVTMLQGARLSRNRNGEESFRDAALKLVKEFMEAMDKDKEEGLDPDTARLWKDQVHEIAAQAKFDQSPEGDGEDAAGPSATAGTDHLAPLKSIIEQATYTMEAATKEIQDPNETVLQGFGK